MLEEEVDVNGTPSHLVALIVDPMTYLEENKRVLSKVESSLMSISSQISKVRKALKEETDARSVGGEGQS